MSLDNVSEEDSWTTIFPSIIVYVVLVVVVVVLPKMSNPSEVVVTIKSGSKRFRSWSTMLKTSILSCPSNS